MVDHIKFTTEVAEDWKSALSHLQIKKKINIVGKELEMHQHHLNYKANFG
jgi:hypothetical protein